MKQNIIGAIAVLGLVVGVWALASIPRELVSNGPASFGATTASGMLAENYIPYVLYNGGYNTAKDINTSAFLGSTGTFQLGSSGTSLSQIIKGTGNLTSPCILIDGASITASSSKAIDCAVTGVVAGDSVFVMPATTTKTGSQFGWAVSGASASSTSGFVTVILQNQTGANAVPPSTATSTSVLIVR